MNGTDELLELERKWNRALADRRKAEIVMRKARKLNDADLMDGGRKLLMQVEERMAVMRPELHKLRREAGRGEGREAKDAWRHDVTDRLERIEQILKRFVVTDGWRQA